MADADGAGDQQAVLAVAGGVGILLGFFDILDGDKTGKMEVLIDDGELFHLAAQQQRLRFLQRDALRGSDEVLLGHDLADGNIEAGHEFKVAVGDDAHQLAVGIADGDTADVELAHQTVGIADKMLRREEKGIIDDAVFTALDPVDLVCLLTNGHILVNDANAALPRHGNRHTAFGNGIHGGTEQRGIEVDIPCQTGAHIDIGRQNAAVCRHHQNVIKGECFRQKLGAVIGIKHRMIPLLAFIFSGGVLRLAAGAQSGRGVPPRRGGAPEAKRRAPAVPRCR